jgi:molecular chaperone GrpE (heat shock protein)
VIIQEKMTKWTNLTSYDLNLIITHNIIKIKQMIKESILEENVNIYLSKMENKLVEDQRKIQDLTNKINNSAKKIQKTYRRFIFYKKTAAARKIQKFWKKMMKIMKEK